MAESGVKKARPPQRQRRKKTAAAPSFQARWLTRRTACGLWVFALLWWIGLAAYPPGTVGTRWSGLLLAASLAAGAVALSWRIRYLRWTLLSLAAVGAVFWMLPGRSQYDRLSLRAQTARALLRYEGARYCRGGESVFGIDAPGLLRRGVIDAAFLEGWRTANPWLFHKAAALWWRDSSILDLGNGARGLARRIAQAPSLKGFDDANLHPGDFAVTEGGLQSHAMAYLGEHLWIEADPETGTVLRINARATDNPWFGRPVSILRWRFLEAPRPR